MRHSTDAESRFLLYVADFSLSSGTYRLLIGWYEPASGPRVDLMYGLDAYRLYEWTIE